MILTWCWWYVFSSSSSPSSSSSSSSSYISLHLTFSNNQLYDGMAKWELNKEKLSTASSDWDCCWVWVCVQYLCLNVCINPCIEAMHFSLVIRLLADLKKLNTQWHRPKEKKKTIPNRFQPKPKRFQQKYFRQLLKTRTHSFTPLYDGMAIATHLSNYWIALVHKPN